MAQIREFQQPGQASPHDTEDVRCRLQYLVREVVCLSDRWIRIFFELFVPKTRTQAIKP